MRPVRLPCPADAGAGAPLRDCPPLTERPLRLLDPPEEICVLYAVPEGPPAQFVWRRVTHRTTRYQGPERIAPEWWHDRPGTRLRDYFKVEDDAGRRYWLYREGLMSQIPLACQLPSASCILPFDSSAHSRPQAARSCG